MDLARQFASKSIYKFKKKVGSGGSAEVFLYSRQTDGFPEQDVVLKVLKSADEQTIRELLNEGRRLGALRHPNILTTFGYERIDDERFGLILEYFPGENLKALIPRFSNDERPAVASHVISVLCEALSLAHSQEIVHGDFGGRNVLVSPHGQIKLADFGLACRTPFKSDVQKRPGSLLKGSADYLAPERWEGDSSSTAADIFSLGILAYEILAGTNPLAHPSSKKGGERVQNFLARREWARFLEWREFFEGTFQKKEKRLPAQELLKKIPFDKIASVDIAQLIAPYVEQEFQSDKNKTQTHILDGSWGYLPRLKESFNSLFAKRRGNAQLGGHSTFVFGVLFVTAISSLTSLATGKDQNLHGFFRPCLLTLTSQPWGELFIDGVSQGYTPFINLPISPGFHKMKWRDGRGRTLEKTLMAYENSSLAFKILGEYGRPQAQPLPSFGSKRGF